MGTLLKAVFQAHVEATVEAAHSNGPVGHRCQNMHGHSWRIEVEWIYGLQDLNEYGWGPDFGAVKAIIRRLDHSGGDRGLNGFFNFPPSAENIAQYLFREIHSGWPEMQHLTIIIHEGGGNTLTYTEQEVDPDDDGR